MAKPTPHEKSDFTLKEIPNAFFGFFGVRTERELPYDEIHADGAVSIRRYDAHAEIVSEHSGPRMQAVDRLFHTLFSYLRGENEHARRFDMTTPVFQRPGGKYRWSTSFFLDGPVENLPSPRTPGVKLEEVAERIVAVLRFRGLPDDRRVSERSEALKSWLSTRNYKPIGEAEIAQFDQPFAIPFLRRNEIHIPIGPSAITSP